MRKTIYLIVTSFLLFSTAQDLKAQKETWNTLAMVTFDSVFDEDFGIHVQKPVVNPVAQALADTEILVDGFIIPLTGKVEQSHFMLSRYPQSMCFFCGKAGPESAMQVFMKGGKKVPFTDKKIKVKGTLRINATDINNLLYTLDQAEIIE